MTGRDDPRLVAIRRDLSGGVNSRQEGTIIGENQCTLLYNVDLGTPGQTSKRPGSTLIGNDASVNTFAALHNYERQGYTSSLIAYDDTRLIEWAGSGNWAAITDSSFTTAQTDVGIISAKESGHVPDDVFIVQNGTDNACRFTKNSSGVWSKEDLGDTANSPPLTTVMCWYGNRIWCLKNDLLYYSNAYPATYSSTFDRSTSIFRIPVGQERGLVPTRDLGIIVMGRDQIWGFAPTTTPAATDKPEPIVTNRGVVSKKGWVNAGDDIYYFAQDGFRALKRTVQDKLQAGADYPISYFLKDEFDKINWTYIDRLTMEYFDNKIFIGVPTGAATFDTWVFYPATNSFMIITGWLPRQWAKYRVGGEERLYYAIHGNGAVYRAWYGYTDEGATTTTGTAINYQEEGRKEDLGQPLVTKFGGTLKIRAISSGDYTVTISASIDDQAYNLLGTLALQGTSPTLPATLPFTLADTNIVEDSYSLDALGEWRSIKIKLQHNAANGSDDIIFLERSIATFACEYQDE